MIVPAVIGMQDRKKNCLTETPISERRREASLRQLKTLVPRSDEFPGASSGSAQR